MRRFLAFGWLLLLALIPSSIQAGTRVDPWLPVAGPRGGSVVALALSPGYAVDHTLFAGFRGGGLYRTEDSGQRWQPAGPDDWIVTDVALSPAYTADGTLFAAHGLWTAGYGLHRSTDGGHTWFDVTPAWTGLPDPPALALSPAFPADGTLYVAAGLQTFRSTDGGDTFVQPGGWFDDHSVTQIAFSPAYTADLTLFALVPGDGLWKSQDAGATWATTGLTATLSTFAVSPDYAADGTLLAVTEADGQLHLSTDGGDTWAPGSLALAPGGRHSLHFSPTFGSGDRVVLAASAAEAGAYRSEDGGLTWMPVGWYDPAQAYQGGFVGGGVQSLALAPAGAWDAAAFAGTSTGLYYSLDRGGHWWQGRDLGLPRLAVRSVAAAPDDPGLLLAGAGIFHNLRVDTATPATYDGGLYRSEDGGHTWRSVSGLLDRVQGLAFSPDFGADGTAFAATGTLGQHGYAGGGLYRSIDGGLNWQPVLSGTLCQALALSPAYAVDATLWVSRFDYSSALGLYRSTDGGDTWAPLAPDIHAQVLVPSPAYAADATLFAGTAAAGLQRSTDGGLAWSPVLSGPVTALALSPAYASSCTLYAAMAEPLAPAALYRSTDGGDTWQLLATGIPPSLGGELLAIPHLAFATDGSLLAAIHYGHEATGGAVYRSADAGATWSPVGSGLEDEAILDVISVPAGSMRLYAAGSAGLEWFDLEQGGPAEPGTWTSGGPRGGRAQTLALSPNFGSDGLVLAGEWTQEKGGGQSGLGILRSDDGGLTWAPSAAGTEAVAYGSAFHDVAFSPDFAADGTVFAATWGGLFRSTDGGHTWPWVSRLYTGPFGSITAVAVAPDYTTSGHVLAGGGWGGLYVSRDGGLNWTADYSVGASAAVAYAPDFGASGVAFAGGWNGLSRTDDGGLTWTPVLSGLGVSALALSPHYAVSPTLFVGADALYISHDGATSWISVTLPGEPFRIDALAISPEFATDRSLYAGTNDGLFYSADGGLTWAAVAGYPGYPVGALAISPDWPAQPQLLAGTARGVYRTADGGLTWTLSQGLVTLSAGPLALAGPDQLLAGTYRHGLYASDDAGDSWSPLGLQEMGSHRVTALVSSPAYPADGTLFAALVSTVSIGATLQRTTDGGATWQMVYSTDYLGGLAVSPAFATDHTLYASGGSGRVVRSTDGGDTWAPCGDWPGGTSPAIRLVALPPGYPTAGALLAAGYGFWRLPAGETQWQPAASGLTEGKYVLSLAVSPAYGLDATLLATASWPETPEGALWRSTDGGDTWLPVVEGLPAGGFGVVAFSPHFGRDRTAYLLADGRLYRSLDGGSRWTAVGAPPAGAELHGLLVDGDGTVYVSTDAGVWRYRTPAQDILITGGFEEQGGWELAASWPAEVTGRLAYDGARAVYVGLDDEANAYTYSSARQAVTIPADALTATLRCFVYPVSGEAPARAPAPAPAAGDPATPRACPGDSQYLLLLAADGIPLDTLFWQRTNDQRWQAHTFDLTPYAGQSVVLHFGVCNDGAGGKTGLYVDDVSLVIWRPTLPPEYRLYLPLVPK